jgi:predicted kinase
VPAGVAEARLRARVRGTDPSDATPEILHGMAADADPWPEAMKVTTSGAPSTAVDQVLALLQEVTSGPGGDPVADTR